MVQDKFKEMKKQKFLDPVRRKIEPQLQMISNGSTRVNVMRSEHSSSVAILDDSLLKKIPPQRGEQCVPKKRAELSKTAKKGKLRSLSKEVFVNVFIETVDSAKEVKSLKGKNPRKSNLVTATVRIADLKNLATDPNVNYVELGEPLADPTPIVSAEQVSAPLPEFRRIESTVNHKGGQSVLIGIIDVGGFDFSHPDFIGKDGLTRFIRIWDQGGTTRRSPHKQDPDMYDKEFDYGSELRKEHLDAALLNAAKVKVPAFELERQSQMAIASHATHVASIAAGNLGVCPNAMIAGVLISLVEGDYERRKSFYDSTRLAHAVDYLTQLADEFDVPLSINISLGTNGHAHDTSSAINRWIDAALSVKGRSICVAAGNAGQEVATFEGDLGYVMGRIHTSGRIEARDLISDIDWIVIGNGMADVSENELEIWYSSQDRFEISVRPPGMDWIGPVKPFQYVENKQLRDGSFISIYNEPYHPSNGLNYIAVYLSPFFTDSGIVGVPAGQWVVRLHGLEIRDGRYHGWIERDDPRRLGRVGAKEAWRFPSFFSERSNVDNTSVSSLACGQRIISVANLHFAREIINITSSQGPTRDNRFKPDVCASGTDVIAAKGFSGPDDLWVSMTGTSMASPYVAGVVGLMLAVEPRLTAAQIGGILQSTSRPLPGANFQWASNAGFGRINPDACLIEASRVTERKKLDA